MDYEKKYKNALNWIESIYPSMSSEQQMEAEGVFPELAESEDERIRKALIENFSHIAFSEWGAIEAMRVSDIVAWLEKQGDTDKASYDDAEKNIIERQS